ncbi:hypothetical protein WAF17_09030 [Bernardetia sp. ABR2-2B]|uniref:hypothetical protein n=1 Tax=Bernardetia sp. ABR2-2B TaxID=3127472 RepID=UPI0030D2C986
MTKKIYTRNLNHLQSLIGLKIESAFQEQYFFEGKLDEESLGTLKLEFSNGQELTFDCNQNAKSLHIQLGEFIDKTNFKTDFDNQYEWKIKEYLSSKQLLELGKIKKCFIELLSTEYDNGLIQSGCKLEFENGHYLQIWIIESDNIFYGLNSKPPYYENLKVELKEIPISF